MFSRSSMVLLLNLVCFVDYDLISSKCKFLFGLKTLCRHPESKWCSVSSFSLTLQLHWQSWIVSFNFFVTKNSRRVELNYNVRHSPVYLIFFVKWKFKFSFPDYIEIFVLFKILLIMFVNLPTFTSLSNGSPVYYHSNEMTVTTRWHPSNGKLLIFSVRTMFVWHAFLLIKFYNN